MWIRTLPIFHWTRWSIYVFVNCLAENANLTDFPSLNLNNYFSWQLRTLYLFFYWEVLSTYPCQSLLMLLGRYLVEKCPKMFAPMYYTRYMDYTFVLFSLNDHVKHFHKYLNSRDGNMTFTYEMEQNNSLSPWKVTALPLLSIGNILLVDCTLTSIAIFPISTRKD